MSTVAPSPKARTSAIKKQLRATQSERRWPERRIGSGAVRTDRRGRSTSAVDRAARHRWARRRGLPGTRRRGLTASPFASCPPETSNAERQGTERAADPLSVPSPIVASPPDSTTGPRSLSSQSLSSVPALLDDCAAAAVDQLMAQHGEPTRRAMRSSRCASWVRAELPEVTYGMVSIVARILPQPARSNVGSAPSNAGCGRP